MRSFSNRVRHAAHRGSELKQTLSNPSREGLGNTVPPRAAPRVLEDTPTILHLNAKEAVAQCLAEEGHSGCFTPYQPWGVDSGSQLLALPFPTHQMGISEAHEMKSQLKALGKLQTAG